MVKYCLGRLGRALITMAIVLSIVFLLMRLLPVEGYFGDRSDAMNPKVKEQVLKSLGLLDPWYVQLKNFWVDLFHGDLGRSIVYRKNVPVMDIILPKAKYSFQFGMAALVLEKVIGLPLGVLMARYKGKALDKFGNLYILIINAVPAAVYYLLIQLGGSSLFGVSMLYKPTDPTSWILPTISLSLGGIASTAMWMRRYMVDQMNMDYIKLARAKGMTSSQVSFRHVLRNAFIPMAQSLPASILFTISGSLYVESLYSIPGMGGLLVTAIQRQDNTLVQAMVLIYSAISVCGLLLGDIAMMICDPRIKLTKKGGSR
ncbi:MAG: ABC transporter permease [Lachnospiraceae bacterium]|nr:ABC transporter permease [Lachnospiraceae bacterium]